jgi:hypothetical protein
MALTFDRAASAGSFRVATAPRNPNRCFRKNSGILKDSNDLISIKLRGGAQCIPTWTGPGGSNWKSGMNSGNFGCGSWTTEGASIRRFLLKGASRTVRFGRNSGKRQTCGGKLAVLSRLNSGTEIELTIPGSIAYAKFPDAGRSMTAKKET